MTQTAFVVYFSWDTPCGCHVLNITGQNTLYFRIGVRILVILKTGTDMFLGSWGPITYTHTHLYMGKAFVEISNVNISRHFVRTPPTPSASSFFTVSAIAGLRPANWGDLETPVLVDGNEFSLDQVRFSCVECPWITPVVLLLYWVGLSSGNHVVPHSAATYAKVVLDIPEHHVCRRGVFHQKNCLLYNQQSTLEVLICDWVDTWSTILGKKSQQRPVLKG